jgi:hypothetical protein
MHYSTTIFGQVSSFLSKYHFQAVVGQHAGDRYIKKYSAWNELQVLLYAQATQKDSLREVETGLQSHEGAWYHLGIRSVKRSTLADAHARRSYKIFESTFYDLLSCCTELTPRHRFTFKNPLYALDSTTVELCHSLFPWAKYRTTKGALKMHTLFNVRSGIPEFLTVTQGKRADITEARERLHVLEAESIVVFDRGYVDYRWWYAMTEQKIWWVTRAKDNQTAFVTGQHEKPVHPRCVADEKIHIGEFSNQHDYPDALRRVTWKDMETGETYRFITNNFKLSAEQVALIYKKRWEIELFFKWIKQNLKIKSFLGTSKNAVLSQIWVAMIFFLLMCYIKFQTRFKGSLLELTRMIRETLMVRRQIIDLLSLTTKTLKRLKPPDFPQMSLWN